LAGYSTVGAKVAVAIRTGLDLEISAANLFDRNYELSPGFPETGRVGLVQRLVSLLSAPKKSAHSDTIRADFDKKGVGWHSSR
jgi:hypothetical protein